METIRLRPGDVVLASPTIASGSRRRRRAIFADQAGGTVPLIVDDIEDADPYRPAVLFTDGTYATARRDAAWIVNYPDPN